MTHPTSRGSQAWGGCVVSFRGLLGWRGYGGFSDVACEGGVGECVLGGYPASQVSQCTPAVYYSSLTPSHPVWTGRRGVGMGVIRSGSSHIHLLLPVD
jgi:hypothetical protein